MTDATTLVLEPTILEVICEFLRSNDMVACSQVSKVWNTNFTPHLWHTIDFAARPSFKELHPQTVAKNGHHIRKVKNITKRSELNLLQTDSVSRLQQLHIRTKPRNGYHQHALELIRRNLRTLITLEIEGSKSLTGHETLALEEALIENESQGSLTTTVASFATTTISDLRIRRLNMTRSSFSKVLFRCPNLNEVQILDCNILPEENQELFQHNGVTSIFMSLTRVLWPDSNRVESNPLLVHFPNLVYWDIRGFEIDLNDSNAALLRSVVKKYSPNIKQYDMRNANGTMVHDLAAKVFTNMQYLCFRYKKINSNFILGLIRNQSTLTVIRADNPKVANWSYNSDNVFFVNDTFHEGWMIHLMMSRCPNLTFVDLPCHEMDIHLVDRIPWNCNSLRRLRVRIKGLDTKELIMAAIKKWAQGHYTKKRAAAAAAAAAAVAATAATAVVKESIESKDTETLSTTTEMMSDEESKKHEAKATVPSVAGNDFRPGSMLLDTTSAIATTTTMTSANMVNAIAASTNDGLQALGSHPIVNKVATHLLKFELLEEVWLGYGIWKV
ncbi:hypothetical protein BX616_002804 [Lobosporangium transversale]|uniref:F-box domain-containing protein n=1 Tax=Lobosporangium transversale TaxID=64571 RepID=A0A1Y2H279_9FUNG|nr:hypothetical protein BCR41DRAFT_366793 [Lobosporangium transversale]KAF9899862.1 hypothetical protein BX616_002804 [Lobosporangium transversale]ORZ28091.1 hypothetical protein BCR41DRAFT_366793 [Lobosporangium transversale]|eukprot:XP_021885776.1 hypothetical protein BCR41DRAFT_366793 [Lobosporangium transversale]